MYRNKTITTITTTVICDNCGAKREIGENLDWEGKFNRTLAVGYTNTEDTATGTFINYCRECKALAKGERE